MGVCVHCHPSVALTESALPLVKGFSVTEACVGGTAGSKIVASPLPQSDSLFGEYLSPRSHRMATSLEEWVQVILAALNECAKQSADRWHFHSGPGDGR